MKLLPDASFGIIDDGLNISPSPRTLPFINSNPQTERSMLSLMWPPYNILVSPTWLAVPGVIANHAWTIYLLFRVCLPRRQYDLPPSFGFSFFEGTLYAQWLSFGITARCQYGTLLSRYEFWAPEQLQYDYTTSFINFSNLTTTVPPCFSQLLSLFDRSRIVVASPAVSPLFFAFSHFSVSSSLALSLFSGQFSCCSSSSHRALTSASWVPSMAAI